MKQHQGSANVVSFIEKSTQEKYFPQYHNALDHVLRLLCDNGIGIERKRAQVLTQDIEMKLWETGVLGIHSPQSLLNTVFLNQSLCLRVTQVQVCVSMLSSMLLLIAPLSQEELSEKLAKQKEYNGKTFCLQGISKHVRLQIQHCFFTRVVCLH